MDLRTESRIYPLFIYSNDVQDNSDAQYASFRDNLPILALLLVVHVSLRRMFTAIVPPESNPTSLLNHRVFFDLFFALCFLIGVHGFNTLKIMVILSLNYAIAKKLGGAKVVPLVTWIFNVGVLFLNEWYDGYRFGHIHPLLSPLVHPAGEYLTVGCIQRNTRSLANII